MKKKLTTAQISSLENAMALYQSGHIDETEARVMVWRILIATRVVVKTYVPPHDDLNNPVKM